MRFHDWRDAVRRREPHPERRALHRAGRGVRELLLTAAPDAEQQKDLDFLLSLGDIFTLIVYGQLILEQAQLLDLDDDVVDTIFEVLVQDFSANAITMHGRSGANDAQRTWAVGVVRAPITDAGRAERMWNEIVGAVERLLDEPVGRPALRTRLSSRPERPG